MQVVPDWEQAHSRRPRGTDSTEAPGRGPLLWLIGALLFGGLLAEPALAAPGQGFKVGDRVKFEFMGDQLEGVVTRFTGMGGMGLFHVKFTWRGREREAPFRADDLEIVKKPAPTFRPRTWTDTSGQFRVAATFVERTGENVRLKKSDGTEMTVPLAKLSEADRKWVEQWAAADTAAGGSPEPGPAEAALVPPRQPGQGIKVGDRVKLRFMGEQLEGVVTRLEERRGLFSVKFTWDGEETERSFIPNQLEIVKKPVPEPRTWTDTTGQFRIEATFVEQTGENVRLKKSDGTETTVPLARLSEADRKWVEQWAAAGAAAPGPDETPQPAEGVAGLPAAAASDAKRIELVSGAAWRYQPAAPLATPSFNARPIVLFGDQTTRPSLLEMTILLSGDGAMAAVGFPVRAERRSIVRLIDLSKGQQVAQCELGSEYFLPFDCGPGGLVLTANNPFGKPDHLAIYKPSGSTLELSGGWRTGDGRWQNGVKSAFFVGEDKVLSFVKSNEATFWDRNARRAVASLEFGINAASAFDAAKRRMAVVDDGAIHLIDLENARHVGSIAVGKTPVAALAFSRDGRKLAAYADSLVRTWNLDDGRPLGEIWLIDEPGGRTLAWAGDALLLVGSSHLVDLRLGVSVWTIEKDHAVERLVPGGGNTFWYLYWDMDQIRLVPAVLPPPEAAAACAKYKPDDLDWLEPGPISLDLAGLPFAPNEQQQIRESLVRQLEGHGYKIQDAAPMVLSAKVERGKPQTVEVRDRATARSTTVTSTPTHSQLTIAQGGKVLWRRDRHNRIPVVLILNENETPQQAADRHCRPAPWFFSQANLPKRAAMLPGAKTSLGTTRLTADGAR